jgi:hypothetical protein
MRLFEGLRGGFFLRKKPLSILLPVYTNSENAITAQNAVRVGHPIPLL